MQCASAKTDVPSPAAEPEILRTPKEALIPTSPSAVAQKDSTPPAEASQEEISVTNAGEGVSLPTMFTEIQGWCVILVQILISYIYIY